LQWLQEALPSCVNATLTTHTVREHYSAFTIDYKAIYNLGNWKDNVFNSTSWVYTQQLASTQYTVDTYTVDTYTVDTYTVDIYTVDIYPEDTYTYTPWFFSKLNAKERCNISFISFI
jgi:hypothetical protein